MDAEVNLTATIHNAIVYYITVHNHWFKKNSFYWNIDYVLFVLWFFVSMTCMLPVLLYNLQKDYYMLRYDA